MMISVLSALVCVLVYYLFGHFNPWQGMALGVAGTFEEFCEQNRMNQLFREPVNTVSNLAFLFFGAVCISFYTNDKTKKIRYNLLLEFPEFSLLMGLSFIWLCFGSFFYHASLTKIAQQMDMSGTYAVTVFPIVYNMLLLSLHFLRSNSYHQRKQIATIGFFSIIILDVLMFVFKWQLNGTILLPILILLTAISSYFIISLIKGKYYTGFIIAAFLSCLVAFGLWYMDKQKYWCLPYSIIQGHAVWHILTGLSAFFIYLFLRSMRIRNY
jgi:hypothetical protein